MDYPQNLSESDRQWLSENNISSPTFYYHVKQLRKKACEIPESRYSGMSEKQDVVPMVIQDLSLEKNNTVVSETVSKTDGTGHFQWPKNASEVRPLTRQEFRWLMEGLSIEQPKAIQPAQRKNRAF